jgi:hypothetical protein
MGYNTTVLVLNDALGEIARDPEFGKKLAEAIGSAGDGDSKNIAAGSFANAAMVVESHHSSETSLVALGGNHATVIGYSFQHTHHRKPEVMIKILKEALERYEEDLRRSR